MTKAAKPISSFFACWLATVKLLGCASRSAARPGGAYRRACRTRPRFTVGSPLEVLLPYFYLVIRFTVLLFGFSLSNTFFSLWRAPSPTHPLPPRRPWRRHARSPTLAPAPQPPSCAKGHPGPAVRRQPVAADVVRLAGATARSPLARLATRPASASISAGAAHRRAVCFGHPTPLSPKPRPRLTG